jgi:hypothetical protein
MCNKEKQCDILILAQFSYVGGGDKSRFQTSCVAEQSQLDHPIELHGPSQGLTSMTPADVCSLTNLHTAAMARLRFWLWSLIFTIFVAFK